MIKTKHTPGPWSINRAAATHVQDARERGIAACGGYYSTDAKLAMADGEQEANARLIAAAPELLDALRGLLAARDSTTMGRERELYEEWIPKARAAVAKAEGR